MKKILFSLLPLFAVCMRTTAQTISVEDVETLLGNTTVSIALRVQGAENMTSMHIEITDPSGLFAIQSASATPAWAALFSTGSAGMSAISTSDNAFSGDGIVASVELSMPEDIAVGTYPISISNARINGADIAETTFNVIVTNCVTLDENSTTAPQANAEPVDVLLLRTIKANEWSTICLPFTATGEQVKSAWGDDVQLATFTAWESEEDNDGAIVAISVKFTSASVSNGIEANTPMLMKVSEASTEATFDGVTIEPEEEPVVQVGKKASERGWFRGTYTVMKVPEENLFLSGNEFWYSTGNTTIKGYRGYFEFRDVLDAYYDGSEVKVNVFIDDMETGVRGLTTTLSKGDGAMYNLSGQRVGKGYRGFVIESGKKTLK